MSSIEQRGTCEWRQDDEGTWWSDCGVAYQFTTEHGPLDHGHHFCHRCGLLLREQRMRSERSTRATGRGSW